jgi:hypothetical protein
MCQPLAIVISRRERASFLHPKDSHRIGRPFGIGYDQYAATSEA